MKLQRLLATTTAVSFLWTQVLWGAVSGDAFWRERREASSRQRDGVSGSTEKRPQDLRLAWADLPPAASAALAPAAAARISALPPTVPASSARWTGLLAQTRGHIQDLRVSSDENAPLVIQLQDVHAEASAQQGLAAILADLDSRFDLTVVGLEGASGAFRLEPYREFPARSLRDAAARRLLDDGVLGGPEFWAVTSERTPRLWGVERDGLYAANVRAYSRLTDGAEARAVLSRVRAGAARRAAQVLSPALKAWDAAAEKFQRGEARLADYAAVLFDGAVPAASAYPALNAYARALALEERLDFAAAESERRALLEVLTARLPEAALSKLLADSLDYRLGRRSYGEFHSALRALCGAHGVALDGFPTFSRYVEYLLLVERVPAQRILPELDALETAKLRAWAKSPRELSAAERQRVLRLAEKLLSQSLTRREWTLYRLHAKALPRLLADSPAGDAAALDDILARYGKFYELAERRDQVLVDNLLAQAAASPRAPHSGRRAAAVLVAGGFHTDGVREALTRRNASWAVLSPPVAVGDAGTPAGLEFFRRGPSDLEKIFIGEKLFLNTPRPTARRVTPGFEPLASVAERYFFSLAIALRFAGAGDASEPSARELMRWVAQNVPSVGEVDTWGDIGEDAGVLRVPLRIDERRLEVVFYPAGRPAPASEGMVHRGEVPGTDRAFAISEAPSLEQKVVRALSPGRPGAPSVYGLQSWLPFLKRLDPRRTDHAAVIKRVLDVALASTRAPPLRRALKSLLATLRGWPESLAPDAWWEPLAAQPLILPWRGMLADWPEAVWNDRGIIFSEELSLMPAAGVEKMTTMARKAGVDWNLKGVRFIRGPPESLPGLEAHRFVTWTKDGYALVHLEVLKDWKKENGDVFKSLFLTLLHENHEYSRYLHHSADGLVPEADDLEKWHQEALQLGFHPGNANTLSEILVALPGSAFQTRITPELLEQWHRRIEDVWGKKNPAVVQAFRDIVANDNADDDLLPLLAEFAATPGFDRVIINAHDKLRQKGRESIGFLGELYHASRLKNLGYEVVALNVVMSRNLDVHYPAGPFLEIDLLVRKSGLFYFVEAHHSTREVSVGPAPASTAALSDIASRKLNSAKLKKFLKGVRTVRSAYADSLAEPSTRRRAKAAGLTSEFVKLYFDGDQVLAKDFFEQLADSEAVQVLLTLTDPSGAAFTAEGEAFEKEMAAAITQRAQWKDVGFSVHIHVFPQHTLNRFPQSAARVQVDPLRKSLRAARPPPAAEAPPPTAPTAAAARRTDLAAAQAIFATLLTGNRELYDQIESAIRTRFATKRKINKKNVLVEEILPVSFLPFLRLRAAAVGAVDVADYGEKLRKDWHESDLLIRTLQRSLEPTQGQTEFFYQRPAWGLDEFLPKLIESKANAGDYRLRFKSLGAASGQEPYSLALAAREALEAYFEAHRDALPQFTAQEWIDRWDVQVDAYDVNLPNLYVSYMGVFDDLDSLPNQYMNRFYMTYDKYEAIEDIRRWVVPQYLDLNDADQVAAIGKGDTDVLFLLRTLFQPDPAQRTAILEASVAALARGTPGLFVFTTGSVDEDVPVMSLESDGKGGWQPSARRDKALDLWRGLLVTGAPPLKERAALALGVIAEPDLRGSLAAAARGAQGPLRDAAQWALSRLPVPPEEPVSGGEAVMDRRYALRRYFAEVVKKRRRDQDAERKNWRKHKAILDDMLRSPATLPGRADDAAERVEAIRAQQFRLEGARLRHETARRRLAEARRWEKGDMSIASAWGLFKRLSVEPTQTQAAALALAAKYLAVPPENIFFIDPSHPMAEVAGRPWTAGEEGRMLGMHAVMNDGDRHGRFLFINAAETDLFTLVKTIVHEAWHLQGFPKVPLDLPPGIQTMLEEGITEMRAENTMAAMLKDALADPNPLHARLIASIEERYREQEGEGAAAGPLPDPAGQLEAVLNATPYLDYETLVMDMVEAIGREPLTRLFEQGDTEFKFLLGERFAALERVSDYLLLPPQTPLRLFAAFAVQQILKGEAPPARLTGWELVLGALTSAETYVDWADGGAEGNPWGADEDFLNELVQAMKRFQETVYFDGRLELWAQAARARVEAGESAEIPAASRGEMRDAFLKTLAAVQSERPQDPRRALSPDEAEAYVPADGVLVLQDPRRKLAADEARRLIREGGLIAFLDRGAVVWVPAALGGKARPTEPRRGIEKLDARLRSAAENYAPEEGEVSSVARAEALARIEALRRWVSETSGRFEAAGNDVAKYELFLTDVLGRLPEAYQAVHEDEDVDLVIREHAAGLARRIDPEFGQAVERLIKRLEAADTKAGERRINEAVRDLNARFLLPNGFYLDGYVEDDEFFAAPYRLAAAPLSVQLIPRTPPYAFYIVRALRVPGREADDDPAGDMLAFRDEPKKIVVMFEDKIADEMKNILAGVRGERAVRFFSGDESWNDFLEAVRGLEGASAEDRRFWEGLRDDAEVRDLIRRAHAKDVAPDTPLAELVAKGRLTTALHEFRHFYDDVKKRFAHMRGDRLRDEKYVAVETSAYLAQIALSPMPFDSLVFPFTRLLMPDRKAFAVNRAIGAGIFELLLGRPVGGPRDAVAAFRELLSWDAAALQARARAAYEDRFGPLEENGYTLENVRGLLREAERSNYVDPLSLETIRHYIAGFAAAGALATLASFLAPLWAAALPAAAALFAFWSALVLHWTLDAGLRVREKGAQPLAKDRREEWEFQLGLSLGGPVKLLSTEDMARMSGSPAAVAFVRPEEPETVYLNRGWAALDPSNRMQQFILPIVLAHEGVHRFGPRLPAFPARSPLSAWLNRFLVYPINQKVLSLPLFRSDPVAYFVMTARRLAPFRRFPFFESSGGRLAYHFDKHDAPALTRRAVRDALRGADLVFLEIPHEWVPYYQAVSNGALTPSMAMRLMEEESAYTSYYRPSLHVTLTELYGRRVRVEGDAPLPESVHRKQQNAGEALNRSLSRFLDGDLNGALALFGQHAAAMAEYEGLRNDLLRRRLKAVRQLAPQAKVGVVRGIVHSAHYANIREHLPASMKDIVQTGSLPAGYTYLPYEKLLHALLRPGPTHPSEREELTRQAFFSALMSLDYDASLKQDLAGYSRRMNALAGRITAEQLALLTEHVGRQYRQDVIDNASVPTSQVTSRAEQWIQNRLPAVMSGFLDASGWLLSEEREALHSLQPDTRARRLKRRMKSFLGAARPYAGFALAGGIALGELISPWLSAAAALTRRQFLKGGATALAAAWLSGCLTTLSATSLDVRKVSAPVTQADKDLVARFEKLNVAYQSEMANAVIRPEGFKLRAELLEETRFALENMSSLENFVAGAFQRTMQIADFFTYAAQVDEEEARPSFEKILPALIALVPKSVARKDVTLPRLAGRVAGSLFNTGSAAPDEVADATWALLGRNEVFALALTYVVKHHVWKRLFEDAPGASPFEASLRRLVGGEWIGLLRRAEQPLISIESGRASLDDIAAELEAVQKKAESLDPDDHRLSRLLYQRSMARLALAEFLRDREVVAPNRRAELREHMLNLTVFAYKYVYKAETTFGSSIVVHPRDTFLTGTAFLHQELARVAHEARHQINSFADMAGHLSIMVEGKGVMLPVSTKRHDDLLKQVKEAQTALAEDNQLLGASLEGGKAFRTVLGGDTAANRASLVKDAFRGKGSAGLAQRMVSRFDRRRTIELNPSQTVRAVDALQPRLEHVLLGIAAARKVSTPEEAEKLYFKAWREGLEMFKDYAVGDWKEFFDNFLAKAPSLWPHHQHTYAIGAKVYGMIYYWTQGDREAEQKFINAISSLPENSGLNVPAEDVFREAFRRYNRLTPPAPPSPAPRAALPQAAAPGRWVSPLKIRAMIYRRSGEWLAGLSSLPPWRQRLWQLRLAVRAVVVHRGVAAFLNYWRKQMYGLFRLPLGKGFTSVSFQNGKKIHLAFWPFVLAGFLMSAGFDLHAADLFLRYYMLPLKFLIGLFAVLVVAATILSGRKVTLTRGETTTWIMGLLHMLLWPPAAWAALAVLGPTTAALWTFLLFYVLPLKAGHVLLGALIARVRLKADRSSGSLDYAGPDGRYIVINADDTSLFSGRSAFDALPSERRREIIVEHELIHQLAELRLIPLDRVQNFVLANALTLRRAGGDAETVAELFLEHMPFRRFPKDAQESTGAGSVEKRSREAVRAALREPDAGRALARVLAGLPEKDPSAADVRRFLDAWKTKDLAAWATADWEHTFPVHFLAAHYALRAGTALEMAEAVREELAKPLLLPHETAEGKRELSEKAADLEVALDDSDARAIGEAVAAWKRLALRDPDARTASRLLRRFEERMWDDYAEDGGAFERVSEAFLEFSPEHWLEAMRKSLHFRGPSDSGESVASARLFAHFRALVRRRRVPPAGVPRLFDLAAEYLDDPDPAVRRASRNALAAMDRSRLLEALRDAVGQAGAADEIGHSVLHLAALVKTAEAAEREIWAEIHGTLDWLAGRSEAADPKALERVKRLLPLAAAAGGVEEEGLDGSSIEGVMAWAPLLEVWAKRLLDRPDAAGLRLWNGMAKALGLAGVPLGDLAALAEALRAHGRAFLLPFRVNANLLSAVAGDQAAVPPSKNPFRSEFRRALKILKDACGLVIPQGRLHLIRGPPALKPHWTPDGHYFLPEHTLLSWRGQGMDVVKALVQTLLHEEYERLGAAAGADRERLRALHEEALGHFDLSPQKTARVIDLSELDGGPHFENRVGENDFNNPAEAGEVAATVRELLGRGYSPKDIVITSPYGAQLTLIRKTLSRQRLPVPDLKYLSRFPARDPRKIVIISAVRSTAGALEGLRHMPKDHLVRWLYHAAKTEHPDKPRLVFRRGKPLRVWQSRRGDYYIRTNIWNRPGDNIRTLRIDRFALLDNLEILKGRAGWKKLTRGELKALGAPYAVAAADFAGLDAALSAGPRPILIGNVPTLRSDPAVSRMLAPLLDAYEPTPEGRKLRDVLRRVKEARERGETPVAVLDLDDTVFETRPRTLAILHDHARNGAPADVRDGLLRLTEADVPWYWNDVAAMLETRFALDAAAVEELTRRYFSPDFLPFDRPMPGVARFAQELHAAGAHIVFMSGRMESLEMRSSTIAALRKAGVPNPEEDARVSLWLRGPEFFSNDPFGFAFKAAQVEALAALGVVVAAFDDLGPNVETFRKRFPAAAVFHLMRHDAEPTEESPQWTLPGDYRLTRSLPFPTGPPLLDAGLPALLPEGDLAGAVRAFHNLVPDSPLTRVVQARGPPAGAEGLDDLVRANSSGAVFIPAVLFEEWKRRDLDPHAVVFIALLQKDFIYRRTLEAVAAGRPPTQDDVARWRREAEARGLSLEGPAALISLPILVQMYREHGTLAVNLPSDEEVHALLAELASRHAPTAAHSGRVAMLAARIGRSLGYSEAQLRFLKMAGLLHDIGKITVEDKYPGLLNGSDPNPSDEVVRRFQSHAKAGWDILTERFPKSQIRLSTLHHRRFDGGGYPDLAGLGLRTDLKGHDLPVVAEIVAAADAFDAQVTKRAYNVPVGEREAVERMRKSTGHFDPLFLDALERTVERPKAPAATAFSFDLPGMRWDPAVMEAALAGAREELRTKKTVLVDEVTARLTVPLADGKRVVAVGDLHGDLQGLLVDLRAAGLVDDAGNWSGGADVLVQMGDIIDRGPHSIETYLYLRGLQRQARAKGGDVVLLLGNHELMLLQGDWGQISRNPDYNVNRAGAYAALEKDLLAAIRGGHIQAAYEAGGHVFVHSGVKPMFATNLERPSDFAAHVNQRLKNAAEAKDFVSDHAFFGDLGIFWVETEDIVKQGAPFPVVIGHKSTPHGRMDTLVGGKVVRTDVNHLGGGRGYLVLEKSERRAYSVEAAPPPQGRSGAFAGALALPGLGEWDAGDLLVPAAALGAYALYLLARLAARAWRADRAAVRESLREAAARAADFLSLRVLPLRHAFRPRMFSRQRLAGALVFAMLFGATGYKIAPLNLSASLSAESLQAWMGFTQGPAAPATDALVASAFSWTDRVQNSPSGQMDYASLRDEITGELMRAAAQGKKPVLAIGETHGQFNEYRFAAELMRDVGARLPVRDYLEEEGTNRAHLFLKSDNPYAGAVKDLGARVTFVTGNGPGQTTFRAPLAKASDGLTVVYAGANHIAPVIDWAPAIYNTHGDNSVPHPTVLSQLGPNRPGAAVVLMQQGHVGLRTQEYFLAQLWSRRHSLPPEEIAEALDRFLAEWDLRQARPAAEPVIVKADGIYYVVLPDPFAVREARAVALFKRAWADPALRAELLSDKFTGLEASDGPEQFNHMPWLVKRNGDSYVPTGRSVTFVGPENRTTLLEIDEGRSAPLRFDIAATRGVKADGPSDPRAARLLFEETAWRAWMSQDEPVSGLTREWFEKVALVEAGLRGGSGAALRTGADGEAYFRWLADAHPRTALEYAPAYRSEAWGAGVLRRAAESAATSDVWAALNYAPAYAAEPWAPAVLKAAAEGAAERDVWNAIALSERYIGQPWGPGVLRRAVLNEARAPARRLNGLVMPTPALLYFDHFKDEPYAKEALASLDAAYCAEVLKHGPALQGYPWAADVIGKAVLEAIDRNPLYAFTTKRLYIGVPGGPALFRRSAEAALAKDVTNILANRMILQDQPWGEAFYEAAVMRAVADDPSAAVMYYDRYSDRPYAEGALASAIRRDPKMAAETAVQFLLSSDPALARRILEAVLPLDPRAVTAQAQALRGQPWAADLMKRAKDAEKKRLPQRADLNLGIFGVWLAGIRRLSRGRSDVWDRLRYGDADEFGRGLAEAARRAEEEGASAGPDAAADALGLAHALEGALSEDPARAGRELETVLAAFYEAGFEVIPAVEPGALDRLDPRSLGLRGSNGAALSGARLAALFAEQAPAVKLSPSAGEAARVEASYRRGWLRGRWIAEGRRRLSGPQADAALRAARSAAPAGDTVRTFDVTGLVAALDSGGSLSESHAGLLRTLEGELRRDGDESGPLALVSAKGKERALKEAVAARLPAELRDAARARLLVLTEGKARSWLDGLLDPDRVVRSLETRLGRPVRTEIYTDDARRWKSDWRSEAKALIIEILNDAEFRVFRSLKDVERDLRSVQLLKIQA